MAGFSDFVSITDFGAVSGVDCTAPFRAAVATGRPIYIPAGQLWILGEDEIDLAASPRSSIVIAGAGSLASVLQIRGRARSVFRFALDEIPSRHPTSFDFRGFCINGMEGRIHAGITIIGPDGDSGTLSTVFIDRMFFGCQHRWPADRGHCARGRPSDAHERAARCPVVECRRNSSRDVCD